MTDEYEIDHTQARLVPKSQAKLEPTPTPSQGSLVREPKIKNKVHTMKTYVLELNEEEATWLRGLMQNPFNGQSPDEEDKRDSQLRRAFFDAVEGAGRPNG